MLRIFIAGGSMMWLLLIVFIFVIILSVRKAIDLFKKKDSPPSSLKTSLNAILFWGAIGLILGIWWQFFGLLQAMKSVTTANDISASIVANGISISLISVMFGVLIFLIAALAWYFLIWRFKKVVGEL